MLIRVPVPGYSPACGCLRVKAKLSHACARCGVKAKPAPTCGRRGLNMAEKGRKRLAPGTRALWRARTRPARPCAAYWLSRFIALHRRDNCRPQGGLLQGAFTAFVGARPRSSLGQALRAKLFRQFVRRKAGSRKSTGSHRRATQLLQRAAAATCRSPGRPGSVRLFAHQTWGELMRSGGNGGIKATSAGPKAVFALVRDARVGVPKAA